MKKRTTVSKTQRKISLPSLKTSQQHPKLKRKKRREHKKLFSVVTICLTLFFLTFIFLYLINPIYQGGLISPMPLQKEVKGLLVKEDDQLDKLREQLNRNQIAYATIKRDQGTSFLVTLKQKEEVVFTSDRDLVTQVSSLQVILSRLTMESKRVKRVDLRFDKPVITYR